jgi:hypothetical protein
MQKLGGRGGSGDSSSASPPSAGALVAASQVARVCVPRRHAAAVLLQESEQAAGDHLHVVFAGHGQQVLAVQRASDDVGAAQQGGEVLLDVLRLALLHHQHRALATAEIGSSPAAPAGR